MAPAAAAAPSTVVVDARQPQEASKLLTIGTQAAAAKAKPPAAKQPVQAASVRKVRLDWAAVPGAVRYELVLLKADKNDPVDVLSRQKYIFTNGCEVDLSGYGKEKENFCWKVCGLDYNGNRISSYTPLTHVIDGDINPQAPKPTTEFEKMRYAPLYPVYSWIPVLGSDNYEVQIWRKPLVGAPQLIRDLYGTGTDYYDDAGYTEPGAYYWQVRALDTNGNAVSEWSEPADFHVTRPTAVAALGDSITHGGGAISTPPGYRLYDWESYADVAIKNLGYSGDTVEAMADRFERDVLPFSPRILIIMGGVNNYRAGDSAWSIIHTLAVIRNKCRSYGIIPVFATVTPLNPDDIARCNFIQMPPDDWLTRQQTINNWIMSQPYSVDVTGQLTDDNGWMKGSCTTDGLHPDYDGKKYMGETIAKYLHAHFADIVR
jgi:lysophospholipase L1-like esterase